MRQISRQVPFDDILTDDQARRVGESEHSLISLKESIRNLGLLDAPIVEEIGSGKVRLRAGRSRYKAIKSLREEGVKGFDQISCTVLEFDDHELKDEKWKEYKVSQVIFDSNDKRSQLAQIEQARHYQAQMQQFPHLFPDYLAVAKFNNKDVSDVKEVMDLLSIDSDVMEKIEGLNIAKPGTVPGMCIQEIASAAADAKRPLPAEGQMELVTLLTGPDLKDKRALILRDKMVGLVREVRRKYVPENRGRRKADAGAEQPEPQSGTLLGLLTDDSESTRTINPASEVDHDKGHTPGGSTSAMGEVDGGEYAVNRNSVGHSGGTTSADGEWHSESLSRPLEANGADVDTAHSEDAAPARPPTPSSIGAGIIEVSLINVVRTLENSSPVLSYEQYERLMERLAEIRALLDKAVLTPA